MKKNENINSITKKDIINGLNKIGLKRGMSVEVHSSLKSFGFMKGGAKTIINTLIDIVSFDGAIVMPSFRMSKPLPLTKEDLKYGLTCKIKILDENSLEPTGMGIISDTFRNRKDVKTGKGLFRVSAWGKNQIENSEGFHHLIKTDQWALLLGVDIYSLSSMHYVEEHLPDKIKNIFKASDKLLKIYDPSKWYIETGKPPVMAWYKIQNKALSEGKITTVYIGKAKCMFFKINDVINIYKNALILDPYGLYEIND